MERKRIQTILGVILFVIGIVLAIIAFMSYLGGILSGPFASALKSYFVGPIAATILIVVGGLILMFSTTRKKEEILTTNTYP
jgi:putative Mn2+ efflux pump MntP